MTKKKDELPVEFDELEMVERHRDFLLNALRLASLRAKLIDQTVTTIGVALKDGLIGPETAVAWVKDEGLLWWIGNMPETTLKLAPKVEGEK